MAEIIEFPSEEQYYVKLQKCENFNILFDEIFQFSHLCENFDSGFVKSVYKQYEKDGHISNNQLNCLKRIYNGFRVKDKLEEYYKQLEEEKKNKKKTKSKTA